MSMTQNKRPGVPNWADCGTSDLDAAEQFYGRVFGWTAERVTASDGAVYSIQRLQGQRVAGIYQLNDELLRMNVPPHWATYFEVGDVDATIEQARAAGGTLVDGLFEEPGVGKIAVIQDTVGAFLRVWQSAPQQGGELFNEPGAMIWNELNTSEPDKACRFYETALGIKTERITAGSAPYTLFKVDGDPVAGVLLKTSEMGEAPTAWDVYFASDDVDATAKKIREAGGKVLVEPFDLPVGGRMAVFQDPQGAVFEVIKMESA